MMTLHNLVRDRKAGVVRLMFVNNYNYPVTKILESFGLPGAADALSEIESSIAESSITELLWKDLAYGAECMPIERAQSYSKMFIESFLNSQSNFFTNGEWNNYHHKSGCSFWPVTAATFSAVVLAVHPEYAACLIVDDED